MKRGDLISVSLPGDYGKPRPAVVIQSDDFTYLFSITVLPLTSQAVNEYACRVSVKPTPQTGLKFASQIMVEKISTVPREKAGPIMGRLPDADMAAVDRALAIFLGFA